jgi:hypothetical protein
MFSTKEVNTQFSGIGKEIKPGNRLAKINSISLAEGYDHENTGAYHVVLALETDAIGDDFEGFLIDKDDTSGPRYLGQVGNVKMGQYAFQDGETKTGRKVNRNESIQRSVCFLADAIGKRADLDNAVEKAQPKSLEAFIAIVSKVLSGDEFIYFTIAGRAYTDKNNYEKFDLFLPYAKSGKQPYDVKDLHEEKSKLMKFDETVHIVRKTGAAPASAAPVPGFGPGATTAPQAPVSRPAAAEFEME